MADLDDTQYCILCEHTTIGFSCWCKPEADAIDERVIVHNSMDERETYEQGRKMQ